MHSCFPSLEMAIYASGGRYMVFGPATSGHPVWGYDTKRTVSKLVRFFACAIRGYLSSHPRTAVAVAALGLFGLLQSALKMRAFLYPWTGPSKIMFGSARSQPMCLGCNSRNVRTLLAEDGDWEKKCFLPLACNRCSLFPSLYGSEAVTIKITKDEMRETCLIAGHHSTKVRDSQASLYNRAENRRHQYGLRDVLLAENFGYLDELELKWRYFSAHTGCYRYASTWVQCVSEETADQQVEDGGVGLRGSYVRRFVELFYRFGSLPHSVVEGDMRDDVRIQMLMPRAPAPDPLETLDGVPPASLRPLPDGHTYVVVPGKDGIKVGPIIGLPSLWKVGGTQNKLAGLAMRSEPKETYKSDSPAALKLAAFMTRLKKEVVTDERVAAATKYILDTYGEPVNLVTSKFPEAVRQEAYDKMITTEQPFGRKAQVKREIGTDSKAPRIVIDEGLHALTINAFVGKVLEVLLTHPTIGVFYCLSIKYRPRKDVLDSVVAEWADLKVKEAVCGVEVDQTGMELHERYDWENGGILGAIFSIMGSIAKKTDGSIFGRLNGKLLDRVWFDSKEGIKVTYKVGERGFEKSRTVTYPDVFMTSGWRFTSVVNFLNELSATMVSCVDDPERLLAKHTKGKNKDKFRLQTGEFNYMFTRGKKKVYFRPWVEGDDVLAIASRSLIDEEAVTGQRYKDLGYRTKLKFIVDGRAEFIGAHFSLQGGIARGSWTPNFIRYLCKAGVHAGRDISREAIVARLCSIACMFAGSLPFAGTMFLNLAESHLPGADVKRIITFDEYSEERNAFNVEREALEKVLGNTRQCLLTPEPLPSAQIDLLSGTIEKQVSASDFARLQILADRMSRDLDDREAYDFLPNVFK